MKGNDINSNNDNGPDNLQELGKNAVEASHYACDFFDKLCMAARKDGRSLDPLWGDLAMDPDEDDVGSEIDDGIDDGVDNSSQRDRYETPHHATHKNNVAGIGSANYTTKLILTRNAEMDQQFYRLFRSHFQNFPVDAIPDEGDLLQEKDQNTSTATQLLLDFCAENKISNAHAPTLLRHDALDMFWMTNDSVSEGLLVVPRWQFLAMELCRIHEGFYGRKFRRVLELFDIKTQVDRLEHSLLSRNNTAQTAVESTANEDTALDALRLLRIQWPSPSISALETTGAVSILQKATRNQHTTELVRSNCQDLLAYWKQLNELGNIMKVLQVSGSQGRQLVPSLEKAGELLVTTRNANPTNSSSQQQEASPSAVDDTNHLVPNDQAHKATLSIDNVTFTYNARDDETTAAVFREHGIVVLLDLISDVHSYARQAKNSLDAVAKEHLEPRGLEISGTAPMNYAEIRRLPGSRLDNQYQILDNPNAPIAALGRRLQQELPIMLFGHEENDFRLDRAGVMHAFSSSKINGDKRIPGAQEWQRDGSFLFSGKHNDTHSFSVFIPLVDMTDANGAEEFIPGTHTLDHENEEALADIISFTSQNPLLQHDQTLRTNVPAGTLIVFDVRLLHRSLINHSKRDRPMMYFTFAKKWLLRPETNPAPSINTAKEEIAVHSQLLLLSRLNQLFTGVASPRLLSKDESFGHPFYTDRYDLILLEGLKSDDKNVQATAMANMGAVIHFCKLCEGDKETMAREFVYSLSDRAYERKRRILRKARNKRHKQHDSSLATVPPDRNQEDTAVLCNLTATIIMEEATLLSKLGFTSDENGLSVLLAMLKAHAALESLGCIGIRVGQLEEAFTSWWYEGALRFAFYPGNATSPEEQSNRKVLVIFTSSDATTSEADWSDFLQEAISNPRLDMLQVSDPAFSFFCQDPECQWKGWEYYMAELEELVASYQGALFLGESIGASAALRFAKLSKRVVVFAPQVNISGYIGMSRTDIPQTVESDFQVKLIEAARTADATITVHYDRLNDDQCDQVELLPTRKGLELVAHEFGDNQLVSHLKASGQFVDIVNQAVSDFTTPTTPKRSTKICSGTRE